MHPKKDKSEQPGVNHPEAILKLLPLLETPDLQFAESILSLIHENLCETKDSRLLNGIVDYYMATESLRSIDILLRLKEPHDKHMFDKISELLKNENYRYKALQLFMNLVHKHPSWLYKISNHRIIHILLNILKTDYCAPNLMCGLVILITLLPMIPSQFGGFLQDAFEIFSRLASWGVKKPSCMIDVYMLHLHITIYTLFHRLYGLFPCNFLAYLRSYYGGRDYNADNYQVFLVVIKPMLERVRLHPLLVTASKETELSTFRWKKLAYHDIIVECASISLDFVEGTEDSSRNKVLTSSTKQNFSSLDSANLINCSNQSSCSVNYESDTNLNDSTTCSEQLWSPNNVSSLPLAPSVSGATSPAFAKGMQDAKSYCRQISSEDVPLDIAVEAKPEVLKLDLETVKCHDVLSKDTNVPVSTVDAFHITSTSNNLPDDKNILPAVEAKEEDIDKEVSELTSQQNLTSQIPSTDVRHDTPFCSTTLNLTENNGETAHVMSSSGKSDSFSKSNEDESEEMFNSIPESESQTFVQTFTRYRYLSHHGPPPDIPACFVPSEKRKVCRSVSCPENIFPSEKATLKNGSLSDEAVPSTSDTDPCNNVGIIPPTTTSAFVPVSNDGASATSNRLLTYDKLIPGIVNPLSGLDSEQSDSLMHKLSFSSLSPPELLDRYIQLGNVTYLNKLSPIPITSTQNIDWTHFGGSPPADEIAILRNQVLLLHNLLLFERHRKDVHSERNRGILGRAKRIKMQEEQIVALKDQISLLEQDNRDLKNQVEKKTKSYQQVLSEKHQLETILRTEISRTEQENVQLLYSNKEIKGLLVAQKKENDEIREIYKRCQSEIALLKHQVERANKKSQQCQKIEKDSVFLSKQLILLQELISHYKDRIELLKEVHQPDLGESIMNNAALIEIDALKQKLEAKHFLLDSTKTNVANLEQSQSELKAKIREHDENLKRLKDLHKDEIEIRDERLRSLKNVSAQKDAHILNLYKQVETVSEEKKSLEVKLDRVTRKISDGSHQSQRLCSRSTSAPEGSPSVSIDKL